MKWTGRLCSLLLALMMVLTICPITAFAVTTPSEVSAVTAAQRVEKLRQFVNNNSYGYRYFTTTGKNCANASPSHECRQCLTTNLMKESWIKSGLGLVPDSDELLPYPRWASPAEAATYGKVGTIDAPAYSCVGFAMIAHWFIYAQKSTDNLAGEHIASIDLSNVANAKASLDKYARVGDLLVYRSTKSNGSFSHVAIYTGYNSSGITVIDSNWGGSSGPTCKMQEHTISYGTYRYLEITRATNASKTKTYTVTYNANGGTGAPAAQIKTDGVALTLSSTIPTRNGYSFLGWATSAGATTAQYRAGGSYTANAGVTLYAVWEAWRYPVKYDANGGTGAPATQDKIHDKTLMLSTVVPQREGYVFKGWRDLSPIEGVWSELKPASGSYETAYEYYCYGYEHNGDMTFWYGSDKSYVESLVKENLPSGTGYDAKKLRLFIIIEDTNRGSEFKPANGGTFEATYVNSDNTSGITTLKNTLFYYKAPLYRQSDVTYKDYQPGDAYTTNCNMTLTAMWEATGYTVQYDANGGTGAPAAQSKVYNVTLTLSSTIPTRTGYNFLGWATTPGATAAQYSAGGSYTANAGVTLYAVWQKEQASAATAFTVGSTTSLRGKEVLIPISISGNPGVAAVRFKISYDKTRLELTGCEYSSELDWMVNPGDNAGAVLVGTKNYTADGEILWLKFTVLDSAPDGMASVAIGELEVYDVDENEIACSVASGGVMVISKISGDVSDDGTVDALDALRLKKYLAGMQVNINSTNADVNADGKVSIADLLRLMKYLAGMEVELQ